jgi:predicted RNA-binding Zn-ribbon protein involved in translation (DUF1610 family)
MAASQASSQTTQYWTGQSNCPNGRCPQVPAAQFVQPRLVEAPKPVKVVEAPKPQPLDWELGRKKPLSVDEAIAKALKKNSVRTEPSVPTPPKSKPINSAPIQSGQGMHSHQCQRCGNVFSHSEANFGNASAHMCPKCGYGPNYRVLQ